MNKKVRVNSQIIAPSVRLISEDGKQLGIFSREVALKKAQEANLDLVEVAPDVNPPVCRIMDFSKYRYQQEKRERELRKSQKQAQLKEIRIRPNIDPHDLEIKIRHIKEFLTNGHKVRIRLMFRGRELMHQELGKNLIDKIVESIKEEGKIDKEPMMLGSSLITIISPK